MHVDQAMFRKVSQWPNAMFKVPDLLEWLVLVHEPKVVDELLKAPEDVLSSLRAVDEVSSLPSSPR